MAYTKQNFEDGSVLKAEHLNHIEDGIIEARGLIQDVDERLDAKIDDQADMLSKGYISSSFEYIHGDITNGELDTSIKHTIVTSNIESFSRTTTISVNEGYVMSLYLYNDDSHVYATFTNKNEHTIGSGIKFRISVKRDDHEFNSSEIADIGEFSHAIKIKTDFTDRIDELSVLVNDLNEDYGTLNRKIDDSFGTLNTKIEENIDGINSSMIDTESRLRNDLNNKQDKLINDKDYEAVPIIIRNSDNIDYKLLSQGVGSDTIPLRTPGGALRVNFNKKGVTALEENELAVNLGYLNERLAGIGGGGGSLYIHDVTVNCSNYMMCPYGFVYLKFLTNGSTPITTLAEIHELQQKQLSVDFKYHAEDNPDGARDAVSAWVIAYGNNNYSMQISYVTAYTVPLTTERHEFNSDVCTISDTVTEV